MNLVRPIKDMDKIKEILEKLKAKNKRDHLMFAMGISTGLRISDLRVLKVEDVEDKTHIKLREKKTSKSKRIYLNESIRKLIQEYVVGMDDDEFLFQSRKGRNQALSRSQCSLIISNAGKSVGLESIGTHSLRKSFGYHHYQKFKDIMILMKIFNHSHPKITERYIGLDEEQVEETLADFDLLV